MPNDNKLRFTSDSDEIGMLNNESFMTNHILWII